MEEFIERMEKLGLELVEFPMPETLFGLYGDNVIAIKPGLTYAEKRCTLCEELAHFYTSYGDILDKKDLNSIKQERLARAIVYRELVSFDIMLESFNKKIDNLIDFCEEYDITMEVAMEAMEYYKNKYGIVVHNGYELNFYTNEIREVV